MFYMHMELHPIVRVYQNPKILMLPVLDIPLNILQVATDLSGKKQINPEITSELHYYQMFLKKV